MMNNEEIAGYMVIGFIIIAAVFIAGYATASYYQGDRLTPSQVADKVEYYAVGNGSGELHSIFKDDMTIGEAKDYYKIYKEGPKSGRLLLEAFAAKICYGRPLHGQDN